MVLRLTVRLVAVPRLRNQITKGREGRNVQRGLDASLYHWASLGRKTFGAQRIWFKGNDTPDIPLAVVHLLRALVIGIRDLGKQRPEVR